MAFSIEGPGWRLILPGLGNRALIGREFILGIRLALALVRNAQRLPGLFNLCGRLYAGVCFSFIGHALTSSPDVGCAEEI